MSSDTPLDDPSHRTEAMLLYALIKSVGTPVVVFDSSLTFYFANPCFERLCGRSTNSLQGRSLVGALVPQARRHDLLATLLCLKPDGPPEPIELPILRSDGEEISLSMHLFSCMRDGSSDLLFLCLGREAFGRHEPKLTGIYADHSSHLMWRATSQGGLVDCNQAVLEYSGLPLEELSGKGWGSLVHPEEYESAREVWRRAVTHDGRFESRHRLRRGDGEYRWHLCRMSPGPADASQERIWFGIGIDIHEDQLAAVDLREREQWLRTLFQAMHDGLTVRDPSGTIALVNQAAQRIMGLTADQFSGLTPSDPRWGAFRPDGIPIEFEELPSVRAVATGQPQFGYLMCIRHPDSRETWVNVNSVPVLESDGTVSWVVATYADVTEHVIQRQIIEEQKRSLEQANARLHALATEDGLTGLLNHRALHERLSESFAHARRYKRNLSLILLDVDRFKLYNDAHGHLAGDEVLRRVAKTLRDAARTSDVVGRYGGEEFLIILPETDFKTAIAAAERFRSAIESGSYDFGSVTASFGVSTLTEDHTGPGQLLDNADRAMYAAKIAGRNRVVPPISKTVHWPEAP